MFKLLIIETALKAICAFLENPKNDKVKDFLLSDATQKTFADIYAGYSELVEKHEA